MRSSMPESVNNPVILRELLRYRNAHLALLLLVFSISALVLRYMVLDYSAVTTVVVIDGIRSESKAGERMAPDYLLSTDQFNRIHQVVYSDSMYDHLIRTFRLFDHYRIDSAVASAYAETVNRLSASIELKKTPYNAAVITVNDHELPLAIAMADEIANRADRLNREWLMRIQEKRIAVYQTALNELEHRISDKQTQVEGLLKRLSETRSDAVVYDHLSRTVNSLTATIESFRLEARQLVFVLQTLQQSNSPTIWQQERARSERSSLLFPSLLWSLGVTLLFLVSIILFHYSRLLCRDPFFDPISRKEDHL